MEHEDLVERLLAAAAALLEDASAVALVGGETSSSDRVAEAWQTAQDAELLLSAAARLERRGRTC